MEIRDLRTFLAVADAKSFLKAADTLFIYRQAISKTILHLEEELNLGLFVRNQSGAMMTPAGIYLYSRASQLVQELDRLKTDTMDLNRSYRPVIRLFLSQGLYGHYAGRIFEYGRKYSAEMDLQLSSCFDKDSDSLLADRKAEAVVSFKKPDENIARSVKIQDSALVFLVNYDNQAMKKEKPSFRDFSHQPLLLYTSGLTAPLWWYDHPRENDILSGDLDYLFSLLREDKGVLPIPETAIPSYADFAARIQAPSTVSPIPVYYSTLYTEHYTLLQTSLLDALEKDIFE